MSTEKHRSVFGANLRRLRLERGLTQAQLGERVGLSKRMVAHYELHATRPPAEKLAAIAQALNVKVDLLLTATNANPAPRVDPKFARKLERAKKLPRSDQMLLATMIDSMLKKRRKTR